MHVFLIQLKNKLTQNFGPEPELHEKKIRSYDFEVLLIMLNIYENLLIKNFRYYYKSQVLLPVFGRRLVYKFGPNATGWRPQYDHISMKTANGLHN